MDRPATLRGVLDARFLDRVYQLRGIVRDKDPEQGRNHRAHHQRDHGAGTAAVAIGQAAPDEEGKAGRATAERNAREQLAAGGLLRVRGVDPLRRIAGAVYTTHRKVVAGVVLLATTFGCV